MKLAEGSLTAHEDLKSAIYATSVLHWLQVQKSGGFFRI